MVRTRFAPSPTGYLHIGGVRTALFNWLFAKQAGGQFLLRIDDTDQQRNVEAALKPILDGFRWLGMDWDEGPEVGGPHEPYFQSQRSESYAAAVQKLLDNGSAYRDYARPEELQEQRDQARKDGGAFVYDRRWMATDDATAKKFEAEGREQVVRLMMPREGVCIINDLIRGDVQVDWASEQDHVIQRTDGSCLYHLASVVDDHLLEITHVIRAEEHLPNTPRQIFIAQSLGYPLPAYAHLPYVAEPGGTAKLSKRKLEKYKKNKDFASLLSHGMRVAERSNLTINEDTFNPVIVDFYREIGFLPDAILNYLLLLGWSLDGSTEKFSREEMLKVFTLERVNRAPASFDPQKLQAFQTDQMMALDMKKKVAMVLPYLQRAGLVSDPAPCEIGEKLTMLIEAAGDRIKVAGDILDFDFCFLEADQLKYDEKAFQKRITAAEDAKPLLSKLVLQLEKVEPFTAANTDTAVHAFCETEGIGMGQIIHALRIATTGSPVGFGMFETLAVLGKEESLKRIARILESL